ncbi:MAG TPA: DUF4288 domain-containing protein [Planctomycetota bacterium]
MDKAWFAAKSLHLHRDLAGDRGASCFEERIVLIRAASVDDALKRAEREAARYARGQAAVEFLGYLAVFALSGDAMEEGLEVYSILRSVALSKRDFIRRYYDDGSFHVEKLGTSKRKKKR